MRVGKESEGRGKVEINKRRLEDKEKYQRKKRKKEEKIRCPDGKENKINKKGKN